MGRPTETADDYFAMAETRFKTAMTMIGAKSGGGAEYNQAMGYLDMCTGLRNLNTGLRATYMLLDEVKTLLKRPR
jgi:hypothetical protein